jgi:hypothetical protein
MNVAFLSPPAFDSEFYSDDVRGFVRGCGRVRRLTVAQAAQSVNVFPDRETWQVIV